MIFFGVILGLAICAAVGHWFRDGYTSGASCRDEGRVVGTGLTFIALLRLMLVLLFAANEITLRRYANGDFVVEKIPVVTKEFR